MIIVVENIKCSGCVSAIRKALMTLKGVQEIAINVEEGCVEISGHVDRQEAVQRLAALGYPELGKNNLRSKTKSYVSCAIGKINH